MSVHLILLALSCGALAASAAGGPFIGITRDLRRARQISILVSATLVTGNAVCLLPGTPAWYSAALVTLSVGGLVWMAVSLMAVRRNDSLGSWASTRSVVAAPTLTYARETPAHLIVTSGVAIASRTHASLTARPTSKAPAPPSVTPDVAQASAHTNGAHTNGAHTNGAPAHSAPPHLSVLPGGRTAGNESVATSSYPVVEVTDVTCWDDDVNWDIDQQAERAFVTRRQLDTIGPPWSRAQGVSVARGIRTYAPQAGRRRAQGSGFGPRVHSAAGVVLQAQLRALYAADAPAAFERPGGTQA